MSDDKTRGRQESVRPSFVLQIEHKGKRYEYPVRSTQTVGFIAKLFWQHEIGEVSRLMEYTLIGQGGILLNPNKKLSELHVSRKIVYRVRSRWRRPRA